MKMKCANENFEEREFVSTGIDDYACTVCGWLQFSAAGGAAELCRFARWHSLDEYNRFAAVARESGYEVPDIPPHFEP